MKGFLNPELLAYIEQTRRCYFCGRFLRNPRAKRSPKRYRLTCDYCERSFISKRPQTKFCSVACYHRDWRERRLIEDDPYEAQPVPKSGIIGINWNRAKRHWRIIYRGHYIKAVRSLDEAKLILENYKLAREAGEEREEQCA